MLHIAYLMPLLPLAGFVVLAVFGRRIGDPVAGWIATIAVGASFVVALLVTGALLGHPAGTDREYVQSLYSWISAGPLQIRGAVLVDPLSMTMALFVTGISTLIHLYSIGYMKGDSDYPKFFLYLNLFVASMLVLVLGSNLLVTFVGWEGVGVCSYWLVSFWFGRDSAASAGKKAFIYNRMADVGFLLAIFLVFQSTGTISYRGDSGGVSNGVTGFLHLLMSPAVSPSTRTAVCLLLFVGAAGKSAQLPLFPWLADAMEGPTPVSALIHAATMVTAGIYLMCRIGPVLSLSHSAQIVVATIGVATAFVGATIGCAQQDIKKVLAYSTVSQLGYMFLAVGTGDYVAAIFLMVAHAFFKGLLFLGAGSVIHGNHDEQNLKRLGGLRKYMKQTFWTMSIGVVAIAGIPPLSGFFAKGDVLDAAFARFPLLWAIGLFTALLTAYYMTRLAVLAFGGDERWRQAVGADKSGVDAANKSGAAVATTAVLASQAAAVDATADHDAAGDHTHVGLRPDQDPHESPKIMLIPLFVLSLFALAGGLLSAPGIKSSWDPLGWLAPVFGSSLFNPHQSPQLHWVLALIDAVVALVGLGLSYRIWSRSADNDKLEPALLQKSYRIDDIYDAVIGKPAYLAATIFAAIVDPMLIDGAVKAVAGSAKRLGSGVRRVQTGYVRQYALGIMVGAVLLLTWAVIESRAW